MCIKANQINGYNVEIHQDENPEDPREWDNLGMMVCFHKRYNLGDKHNYRSQNFNGWSELKKQIIKDHNPVAIIPLYLYDHSGITINTTGFSNIDSARWDWGQIGFAFIPRDEFLKEFEKKRVTKTLKEKANEILLSEVQTYNQYLTGEVYGYVIKDIETEEVKESCWGFFGLEYVEKEATSIANGLKHTEKENKNQLQLVLT